MNVDSHLAATASSALREHSELISVRRLRLHHSKAVTFYPAAKYGEFAGPTRHSDRMAGMHRTPANAAMMQCPQLPSCASSRPASCRPFTNDAIQPSRQPLRYPTGPRIRIDSVRCVQATAVGPRFFASSLVFRFGSRCYQLLPSISRMVAQTIDGKATIRRLAGHPCRLSPPLTCCVWSGGLIRSVRLN